MRARPRIIRATNNHSPRVKTEDHFIDLREARDRTPPMRASWSQVSECNIASVPCSRSRIRLGALLETPCIFQPYGGIKIKLDLQEISAHSEKCIEFTPKGTEASCGVAGVRRRPSHSHGPCEYLGLARRQETAVKPPSTASICPVMCLPASLANKIAAHFRCMPGPLSTATSALPTASTSQLSAPRSIWSAA